MLTWPVEKKKRFQPMTQQQSTVSPTKENLQSFQNLK